MHNIRSRRPQQRARRQGLRLALEPWRERQAANLTQVSLPTHTDTSQTAHAMANRPLSSSSVQRRYHYEDVRHPMALTGVSVLGSGSDGQVIAQRLSTFLYNERGQASLSVRGAPARLQTDAGTGQPLSPARLVSGTGVQQVHVQILRPALQSSNPNNPPGQTLLANSLGQQTLYTHQIIGGEHRLVQALGAGCAQCGPVNQRWAYDRLGRMIEQTQLSPVAIKDGQPQGTPQPLLSTRHTLDAQGRSQRIEQVAFVQGKAQPARLVERHEYADTRWPTKPTLIARPSVVSGLEQQIALSYNEAGQVTQLTETGWSPLDKDGQPASTAALASKIERSSNTSYTRINGRSLPTQVDGPLPNGPSASPADSDITRFEWDARGSFLLAVTHPMGLKDSFAYDTEGINPSGRVLAHTGVDGVTTHLKYQPDGNIGQTDRAGNVSQMSYTALGRLQQVLAASGARMNMWHNASGHLTGLSDQQNNRIELERNSEGQLLQARLLHPDGSAAQKSLQFPQGGEDAVLGDVRQLIQQTPSNTHAAGHLARPDLTRSPYADLRAWTSSANASGYTPPSAYSTALDSQGRTTEYWHNDFGQLERVQSPVTGVSRFVYDAPGRLIERIQADASRASYTRDAAGRVIAVQSRDAQGQLDEDARISWGLANKPSRITYLAGEESFAYDAAARLTEHQQTIAGKTFTLRHSYNAAGQRTGQQLPGGEQLAYRYRGSQHPRAGLLESVWLRSGLVELLDRPVVQGINSEQDRFTERGFVFGNGLRNDLRFDDQGRITEAGNAQVGQTRLSYGGAAPAAAPAAQGGGPLAEAEPTEVQTRQTVRLSQQAQAQAAQALWSRLRSHTTGWRDPLQEVPHAVPPAMATSTDPAQALLDNRFDALGRQITQGPTQFEYDSLGRLSRVTRIDSASGQATEVARYRYNLFGQRIAKTVATTAGAGGSTSQTTYLFHDGSQLVAEANASGAITKQYLWINDKPVGLLQAGQLLAIHTDHRNAPLAVTDQARRVLWQAHNSDYLLAKPAHPESAQLGTIALNLRGSNQYFDAETGLHYNTHRYFDPLAQRYLSPDPLGLAVGPDLYAFALGQPHSMSDPLGLQPRSNADSSLRGWTYENKLQEIITRAAPQVPGEIGSALQELVQPENLAVMGAIFGIWVVAQATPVGWVADLALLGMGIWFAGSGVIELFTMFTELHRNTNNANCEADLNTAATSLARRFVTGTGELAGGLAGTWGLARSGAFTRIASGIRTVVGFGQRQLGRTAAAPALTITRPSTTNAGYNTNHAVYRNPDGSWRYPNNNGFAGISRPQNLPQGTRLDRFGSERGSFLSPPGTPYGQRALPPSSMSEPYYVYEVAAGRQLPVNSGRIAPAFDQPGGGTQYQINWAEVAVIERVPVETILNP